MIGACIITYNPEMKRLLENIEKINSQVDYLVLVDNGSANLHEIEVMKQKFKNIILLENKKNLGIAAALNVGMKKLYDLNCLWALSLDQDSVCMDNLIYIYKKHINLANVGMIAPMIVDRNSRKRDLKKIDKADDVIYVKWCITSGAFTNLKILNEIGWFDESLFIDFVDYEVCIRMAERNYKRIKLKEAILLHQVGNMESKKIIFKSISVWNHNPIRRYYYFRNAIYLFRKYKDLNIRIDCLKQWLFMVLKVLFYESQKKEKLRMFIRGTKDGWNKVMGEIEIV